MNVKNNEIMKKLISLVCLSCILILCNNVEKKAGTKLQAAQEIRNNQMDIKWFDVDFNNFNNTIKEVMDYIEN